MSNKDEKMSTLGRKHLFTENWRPSLEKSPPILKIHLAYARKSIEKVSIQTCLKELVE